MGSGRSAGLSTVSGTAARISWCAAGPFASFMAPIDFLSLLRTGRRHRLRGNAITEYAASRWSSRPSTRGGAGPSRPLTGGAARAGSGGNRPHPGVPVVS
ncbi:hypothetical protein GCM10022244_11990 [Streptomyces gulbargensis]|uniref:Uncharacterized protein n=1 Tax=Streptomyces gulbargensis TaxID=364901 RepID=A0ABP7LNV6_9ACTN